MKHRFLDFLRKEDGNVMVDWVVLTASIVGLAIVVLNTVGGGVENVASTTADTVANASFD